MLLSSPTNALVESGHATAVHSQCVCAQLSLSAKCHQSTVAALALMACMVNAGIVMRKVSSIPAFWCYLSRRMAIERTAR
jgi:hypothetical protein